MENEFTQLCVWPGTVIGQEDINEFETHFKEMFNVRVKYLTEVKTLPDLDKNGNAEPDTGGRNDAFFFIHSEDVGKFRVPRYLSTNLVVRTTKYTFVYSNKKGYERNS